MKQIGAYFLGLFIMCLVCGCMKTRCYECKDENNNIVARGCDKKAEEVDRLSIERNWNCEILPD